MRVAEDMRPNQHPEHHLPHDNRHTKWQRKFSQHRREGRDDQHREERITVEIHKCPAAGRSDEKMGRVQEPQSPPRDYSLPDEPESLPESAGAESVEGSAAGSGSDGAGDSAADGSGSGGASDGSAAGTCALDSSGSVRGASSCGGGGSATC